MFVTLACAAFRWSITSISGCKSVARTAPFGPDPLGQADAVVARAGADVGDGRALGYLERVEHGLGLLFLDRASRETASRPPPRTSRPRSAGPCRSRVGRGGHWLAAGRPWTSPWTCDFGLSRRLGPARSSRRSSADSPALPRGTDGGVWRGQSGCRTGQPRRPRNRRHEAHSAAEALTRHGFLLSRRLRSE